MGEFEQQIYNKPCFRQSFPTFAFHVAILLFYQRTFSLVLAGGWFGRGADSRPFSGCYGCRCSTVCIYSPGNASKQILASSTAPGR